MNRIIRLIFIFTCLQSLLVAQAPQWSWAQKGGGSQTDVSNSIGHDAYGNIYVTGNFRSPSISFSSFTLYNADATGNSTDLFLVKYDPSGNALWAKSIGGTGFEDHSALAVDSNGFVYLTGGLASNSVTIGTASFNILCCFIAKFDPAGNVVWVTANSTVASGIAGRGIALDKSGHLYVTGSFNGISITFGSLPPIYTYNSSFADIFLVKFDTTGNAIWAISEGGNGDDFPYGVATDNNGNICLTGSFNSTSMTVGATLLYNSGSIDMFLIKYAPNGIPVWAKRAYGQNGYDDAGYAVATDNANNIYVTGNFCSTSIAFGTLTIANNSGTFSDMFLVKYDPSGNAIWAKREGGGNDEYGLGICRDLSNNIFIAGRFRSASITIGTTTLVNNGLNDHNNFFIKYDSSGACLWATKSSGLGMGKGITADDNGNIFVTGEYYNSNMIFGSTYLTNSGIDDMYVAKLSSEYVWPGDANNDLVANNFDLLNVGMYYGSHGPVRDSITNNWAAYYADEWSGIQFNGLNKKFADCNGDSTINMDDTLAINLNYGFVHTLRQAALQNSPNAALPFLHFVTTATSYTPGSFIDADIFIDDTTFLTTLYSIALNISYDAALVQPGTVSLLFPSSWLRNPVTNAITICNTINDVEGAISRINHTNAYGFGKIATLHFQAAAGLTSPAEMHLSITNYRAYTAAGSPVIFNSVPDTILIDPFLGYEEMPASNAVISIWPNPCHDKIHLKCSKGVLNKIKISNAIGETLITSTIKKTETIMDISSLPSGIYFINTIGDDNNAVKKFIKY